VLVVDVGTSNVRAAIVRADGTLEHLHVLPTPPAAPVPGLVEFDPSAIAAAALDVARAALADGGPVAGVGIANQRASTVVWERSTGLPVAPGIGWQDLRTVGTCLTMQADGWRFPPNASATKLAAILDAVDPGRTRADELCFGTIDTWVAWTLSGGTLHVTDATNAALTWLTNTDVEWRPDALEALRIPAGMLPRIVDSSGIVGEAGALPGAPPICGIAGDQQASLFGQACIVPGAAKATFGSGAMLDLCGGSSAPPALDAAANGTFPIVAWQRDGVRTWGVEAMMLSAGSCVEWLCALGLLGSPSESEALSATCGDSGDVWFVPALMGLGSPVWDFGARATLLGVSAGTGRAEVVRAVLEGIAHRGADLIEAAQADAGLATPTLRLDGGMAANAVFVQALADATGLAVELAREPEATTRGAGYLAGVAAGVWADEVEATATYTPRAVVDPGISPEERERRRARWQDMRGRAERTVPELSALSF
jgi:glycerol kinase